MSIKFPRPRLPTAGLPDREDIIILEERRAQEAVLEAAADSESQRRAVRNGLRAAIRSVVQADLKT